MVDDKWKTDASGQPESLDADAVCAQCNEVNPADTLICHVCGNNLRDQRRQRLMADAQLMGEETTTPGVRWLPGVLGVLGLLLITITALNVDRIADSLVDTRDATGSSTFIWSGADGADFDMMTSSLREVVLSSQEIYGARASDAVRPEISGTYVIYDRDTQTYIGRAEVAERETGVRFVAILENGVELRGEAVLSGRGTFTVDWLRAGGQTQSDRFAIHGVATRQADCYYEGFGESTLSDEAFGFEVFCLPERSAQP